MTGARLAEAVFSQRKCAKRPTASDIRTGEPMARVAVASVPGTLTTRPLSDSTDSLLRFAMRADATLTGLCGLAVAFVADPLSSLTGLTSGREYAMGAFFVLCGLVVFSAMPFRTRLRRARSARYYSFRRRSRLMEWSASLRSTRVARGRGGRMFSTRLGRLIDRQISLAASTAFVSFRAA